MILMKMETIKNTKKEKKHLMRNSYKKQKNASKRLFKVSHKRTNLKFERVIRTFFDPKRQHKLILSVYIYILISIYLIRNVATLKKK